MPQSKIIKKKCKAIWTTQHVTEVSGSKTIYYIIDTLYQLFILYIFPTNGFFCPNNKSISLKDIEHSLLQKDTDIIANIQSRLKVLDTFKNSLKIK